MSKAARVTKPKSAKRGKRIDLDALNESFVTIQQTKMSRESQVEREKQVDAIVPMPPKFEPVSKEAIAKAEEDLSKLLKDL